MFLCCILQLLVTANVVSSSLIVVTLMMKVIRSSKMSILTRATLCNIPEDGILQVVTGCTQADSFEYVVMCTQ
jgi:hypothetical protein